MSGTWHQIIGACDMHNSNESNATWFRMDGPLKRIVVTPVPVRLFTTKSSLPKYTRRVYKEVSTKEWMHRSIHDGKIIIVFFIIPSYKWMDLVTTGNTTRFVSFSSTCVRCVIIIIVVVVYIIIHICRFRQWLFGIKN